MKALAYLFRKFGLANRKQHYKLSVWTRKYKWLDKKKMCHSFKLKPQLVHWQILIVFIFLATAFDWELTTLSTSFVWLSSPFTISTHTFVTKFHILSVQSYIAILPSISIKKENLDTQKAFKTCSHGPAHLYRECSINSVGLFDILPQCFCTNANTLEPL